MIRNVVLGRLDPDLDPEIADEKLDRALAGIAGLRLPGQLSVHIGRDVGLRAGSWTFAITSDWADGEAYRRYDADPEHNVYRGQIVEVCAEVARVQFEIPD